jgi:hypothetical protein
MLVRRQPKLKLGRYCQLLKMLLFQRYFDKEWSQLRRLLDWLL